MLPLRGISSVGRALAWHARGQEFDSPMLHHFHRGVMMEGVGFGRLCFLGNIVCCETTCRAYI